MISLLLSFISFLGVDVLKLQAFSGDDNVFASYSSAWFLWRAVAAAFCFLASSHVGFLSFFPAPLGSEPPAFPSTGPALLGLALFTAKLRPQFTSNSLDVTLCGLSW